MKLTNLVFMVLSCLVPNIWGGTPEDYTTCALYICAQSNVTAFAPQDFSARQNGAWDYWRVPGVPPPTVEQMDAIMVAAKKWKSDSETDFTKKFDKLLKAFALVSIEQNNKHREREQAIKNAIRDFTDITDLRARFAAMPDTPTNSVQQMIDAVRAKAQELP